MVFAKAMWTLLLLASFVDGAIAEQKLTASDAASLDYFSESVSVSGDYAVVGAGGDAHLTRTQSIWKVRPTTIDGHTLIKSTAITNTVSLTTA
jgi:hypothetical protein